jgi:sensor domain CHASE-containing protein
MTYNINTMPLRVKVLILVIVLNIITVITLNYFGHRILVSHIHEYKETNLEKRLKIVKRLIDNQINVMDNSVRDYAYWDDTYAFLQEFDSEYVDSNLGKQTFSNIEVDYIAFFDVLGGMYYSVGYKHDTGEKYDISPDLAHKLEELSFALYSENKNAIGVITSEDKTYYVASRPVLRSDKTGPATGTLMMMREFDSEISQKLNEIVQDPYEIHQYGKMQETLNKSLNAMILDRSFVLDNSNDVLIGYTLINGINSEPTLVVSMKEDSTLSSVEDKYIKYLNIFLILIFLLNLTVTVLFMEKLVLKPLQYLVNEVDKIRTRKVASQRLVVNTHGEFQQLATNINAMLDALDIFDKKLVAVNKAMEEKTKETEINAGELERLNRHMVGRELRMAELKEKIEELQYKLNEKNDDIQQ